MRDFVKLESKLRTVCSRYSSEVEILLESQASDFSFRHNSGSEFPSASIIKLFILDYVLKHERKLGTHVPVSSLPMTDDSTLKFFSGSTLTISGLLSAMIDLSDNTATNYLIRRYGMKKLNDHIRSSGWKQTKLRRFMLDFEARNAGLENTTSLDDTFSLICQHTENPEGKVSGIFLDMMRHQHDRSRIPLLLPESITGSKSGSLDNVYSDVAFIITGGGYSYAGFLARDAAAVAARTFIPKLSILFFHTLVRHGDRHKFSTPENRNLTRR
jgi:beta-lactamase class A